MKNFSETNSRNHMKMENCVLFGKKNIEGWQAKDIKVIKIRNSFHIRYFQYSVPTEISVSFYNEFNYDLTIILL